MKIFITGGSGTLGKELVKQLVKRPDCERIVVYSRDEGKHAEMRELFPEGPPSVMRYRIGDIRDRDRIQEAMDDCTHVIHAAAMKRIDDCANHVQECVKTNVIGTMNVIDACELGCVEKALFISTDKACASISAYGASKYMAEHAWIHANSRLQCKYAVCRYGNVIGSRGSVFHKWRDMSGGEIPVTDMEATRFFWAVKDAAEFALSTLDSMQGGCVYVPKMKSYNRADVARNYGDPVEVGMRTNEKRHEYMISSDESAWSRDIGDRYVIYPMFHQWAKDIEIAGDPTESVSSMGAVCKANAL